MSGSVYLEFQHVHHSLHQPQTKQNNSAQQFPLFAISVGGKTSHGKKRCWQVAIIKDAYGQTVHTKIA